MTPKPTWKAEGIELYLGDCLDILPQFEPGSIHAVVTDPPYGIGWDGENLSMSAGLRVDGTARKDKTWNGRKASGYEQGEWDSKRPSGAVCELSRRFSAVIWGGNYFADVLPVSGGWLVWDKGVSMPSLSKCELAWTNCMEHIETTSILWAGYRKDEQGQREHPTQKPVKLMLWCLSFLPDARSILDPFMGSGTTIVACIRTGRRAIGIEREKKYFDIAVERCKRELERFPLFTEEKPLKQGVLLPDEFSSEQIA